MFSLPPKERFKDLSKEEIEILQKCYAPVNEADVKFAIRMLWFGLALFVVFMFVSYYPEIVL